MSTNNDGFPANNGGPLRRGRGGGGGKRSGFEAFARNEKAMELLHSYLSGEIKNQEIFLAQLREANVKICLRTLKTYLSIAKIQRNRKGFKRGNQYTTATAAGNNGSVSAEFDGFSVNAEEEERRDEREKQVELDEADPESLLDLDMDEFAGNWPQLDAKCNNISISNANLATMAGTFCGFHQMDNSSNNFNSSPTKSMASNNSIITNNRGAINQYLNPASMAAEFVNALEEDNQMKAERMEAPEKLLDAALKWIMADEKAMGIVGTDAFRKFFSTICQIQREHLTEGNIEPLQFPDSGEIGAALDRHLAKIEEQRRALDHQQCRILGLRRSLKK